LIEQRHKGKDYLDQFLLCFSNDKEGEADVLCGTLSQRIGRRIKKNANSRGG